MRYIKYSFWAIVAICLIVLGLANRDVVALQALPDQIANFVGVSPTIEMPLFMVIFIGVGLGLLIGFIWEWIREYKHRSAASRTMRETKKLEREIDRLKAAKNEGKDDVLALLE